MKADSFEGLSEICSYIRIHTWALEVILWVFMLAVNVLLCLQKSMSTYVSDCYDSIAIFLCIHIILRFRAITTKRDIPALNKWVGFYHWAAGQVEDKDVCVAQVLGGCAGDAVAEVWTDPGDEHSQYSEHWPPETGSTGHQTTLCRCAYTSHLWQECIYIRVCWFQITRRYAEFSSAIVSINQTFPNERTNLLLGQLQVHQGTPNADTPSLDTIWRLLCVLELFFYWMNVSRWRWKILCWRWLPSSPPEETSSSSSSTTTTWCSVSSWWAH